MSDLQKPNQTVSRGALAEAAERFDRLARGVKDQQLSETRTGPRVALTESLVASPEEAWAKKFMTQSIGPAAVSLQQPVFPALATLAQAPLASHSLSAMQPAVATGSFQGAPPRRSSLNVIAERPRNEIGSNIGKRPGRRTWLGWLLLGR